MTNILDLTARLHRIDVQEDHGWTCVLLAPDVTVAQVQRALQRSGLVLAADEVSGVAAIRRSATPPSAA